MEAKLSPTWHRVERELGSRPQLNGQPFEMREQYKVFTDHANLLMGSPPGISTEDVQITSYMKARIYRPSKPREESLPVGVYYHGGGWCCGDLESEDNFCRIISDKCSAVIISIEYRLAPEHKSPTQVEDSADGWTWAFENASRWNGNQDKYFAVGQSAGGNLALAVANRLIIRNEDSQIKGIVSIVPFVVHPSNVHPRFSEMYQSFTENEHAPANTAAAMNTFFDAAEADPHDSDVFILNSPHLAKFPRTYIVACECDPLRDDGLIMNKTLRDLGVPTRIDHFKGLPHVFWAFNCEPPSGNFMDHVAAGVKFVLATET